MPMAGTLIIIFIYLLSPLNLLIHLFTTNTNFNILFYSLIKKLNANDINQLTNLDLALTTIE